MESNTQMQFYQNTRNIKEAISHFTFHLSVFAIFEVFLIVLPFFVENELSLPVYYAIIVGLSIPVAYLSWVTIKKLKSYKSIQTMEQPLLELREEGFLYRIDLNKEFNIRWNQVEKIEMNEVNAGKVTHKILEIKLKQNMSSIKDNLLRISSYKFADDMEIIFANMNQYICQQ